MMPGTTPAASREEPAWRSVPVIERRDAGAAALLALRVDEGFVEPLDRLEPVEELGDGKVDDGLQAPGTGERLGHLQLEANPVCDAVPGWRRSGFAAHRT